jgi:predicted metal-binding protein
MAKSVQGIIDEMGFEYSGVTAASNLKPTEQVRDMCKANTCGKYNKSWVCPPACGSVDDFAKQIASKETCYVFETVATMEDDFDLDTMLDAGEKHKERLNKLAKIMSTEYPDALVLGAGACEICEECAYPDDPCRFPNVATTAMEAAGLLVSSVCQAAGVEYNHGPHTISYVSCVII